MPKRKLPSYCLHKASGQAYVKLDGRRLYLGKHGSSESHAAYAEAISKWQAAQSAGPKELTVRQLALLYWGHARRYYVKNGLPSGHLHIVKNALKYLNRQFRNQRANSFGPKMLTALRDRLIDDRLSRKYINDLVGVIKRMFKWAAAEELVPAMVHHGLSTVGILRKGRSAVKETAPVRPVPLAFINAIEPHVASEVWGLIQFQLATGCRPGEALIVRACDIDTSGPIWLYRPESHKMEHRGKDRVVAIGPKGQALLRQFLVMDMQAYLFSPSKPKDRRGQRPYRRDAYATAIRRGCEVAFEMPKELRDIGRTVKAMTGATPAQRQAERQRLSTLASKWRAEHCWSPNQLRHNFATMARREFGIEAARVTLGHSSAVVSEIYAERDTTAAQAVVARIG